VARRVQVDAHVILGLVVGQRRTGRDGVLAGHRQVLDRDIQVVVVDRHLRLTSSRP
jgi:hypothetical protein